jgi:hypothetical protein
MKWFPLECLNEQEEKDCFRTLLSCLYNVNYNLKIKCIKCLNTFDLKSICTIRTKPESLISRELNEKIPVKPSHLL